MTKNKILFSAGTSGKLDKEFSERAKYKNLVNFDAMLDTWYDSTFYGRLNNNFEPVMLVPGADELILSNFPGYADDVQVLGFVAEAFRNFRRDYLARVQSTNLEIPVFLSGLVPVSGYINFEEYYSQYLEFLAINYVDNISSQASIRDFPTFVDQYIYSVRDDIKNYPITKSGFLMSKHNDIKTTGLVIELSTLSPSIDAPKGEIIQDPNFSCYLDYAAASGFYVDKNAPWRLLINTSSEIVRLLMRSESIETVETESGPTQRVPEGPHSDKTADDILNLIYRVKSHKDDLYHLQDFMYTLYTRIKNKLDFIYVPSYNGESVIKRADASSLPQEDWLALLYKIRLYELERYEHSSYNEEVSKIINTFRIYGLDQAISKIGSSCSKIIEEIAIAQKYFVETTREGVATSSIRTNTVGENIATPSTSSPRRQESLFRNLY